MKRLFAILPGLCFMIACNNQPAAEADKTSDAPVATTADLQLPYEMQYKNWEMGDPGNVKALLNMYKSWDSNDLQSVVNAFGDTCVFDSPTGVRMQIARPAMLDSFSKWRGMNQSVSTEIITALSLHSTDRMEDWVTIWSMNKWTDKQGKTDSSFSNDNWQLKGGKIVYVTSLEQKPIRNP